MTANSLDNSDVWAQAGLEFESHVPAKLREISSERDFRAMVGFLHMLIDRIGDQEDHPLIGLLDIVAALVFDYEEANVQIPDPSP